MRRLVSSAMLCLALLGLGSGAFAYTAKPIPAGKQAVTNRSDLVYLAYLERATAGAYPTVGVRDAEWDAAAVRYLKGGIRYAAAERAGAPTTQEMVGAGKALVDLGCTDPMVLYCYARALWRQGDRDTAKGLLERAVSGLVTVRYPRGVALLAPTSLGLLYRESSPDDEAPIAKMRALVAQWGSEAATSVHAEDGRAVLRLIEFGWRTLFDRHWLELKKAFEANPKADPWLKAMVVGEACEDQAWVQRGSGYADTVTEAGWAGFAKYTTAARAALTQAWKLRPQYPEAATHMVVMAGATPAEENEHRKWFDRAVAAELNYMPAYRILRWYLRPRWGGSHEAMYALGLECLHTKRYDTNVPLQYWETLAEIEDDSDGTTDLWSHANVYANLKEMFTTYAQRARTEAVRRDNQMLLAASAWRGGKYDDARKALEAASGSAADPFGSVFRTSRDEAEGEIYAFTGAGGAAAREARRLHLRGELGPALAAYQQLLESAPEGPARRYLQGRLANARLEAGLVTGQWTDLKLEPGLPGWRQVFGTWTVLPDGTLSATPDKDGNLRLGCEAAVGDHYEIRGEVEFVPGADVRSGLTIRVGETGLGTGNWDMIAARVLKTDAKIGLSHKWSDTEEWMQAAPIGERATFLVRLEGTTASLSVNGAPGLDRIKVDQDETDAPKHFGFDAGYAHNCAFRLRNLQIRGLRGGE